MVRLVAVISIAIVATVAIAWWLLLGPPPTSGAGWRLDAGATWPPATAGLASTVVPYPTDAEDEIGLGVTVYGSSSCPPKLRDVRIGSAEIVVEVNRGPMLGACTSDAVPHPFGIALQRAELPATPFDVVVRSDEREDRVAVTGLP